MWAELKLKIGRGRPSLYRPEYSAFAGHLAQEGLTDNEIAAKLGIASSTLSCWKNEHPEFSEACRLNKEEADSVVEQSLYQKAIGMKGANGDVGACRYWLSHRQPAVWREQQETDVIIHTPVTDDTIQKVLDV